MRMPGQYLDRDLRSRGSIRATTALTADAGRRPNREAVADANLTGAPDLVDLEPPAAAGRLDRDPVATVAG